MALMHKSKAIKSINKGKTSVYYSYVEESTGNNPVIQQLEKELSDYMIFVKKNSEGSLSKDYPKWKITDNLFDILTRFEPKIPQKLFNEKLLKIGDFLVQMKQYFTALWHCYNRYLNNLAPGFSLSTIQTSQQLKETFFMRSDDTISVYQALFGQLLSKYQITILLDPRLQNQMSVQALSSILHALRIMIGLQLQTENLCWLVYNTTIHVYTIGRYMMQLGFSKLILEYVLFCSLAMENSIPLLAIKYLPWRSTLYSATCQCYYDCRFNEEAENFSRRALAKIHEIYELELASETGHMGARNPEFREATIRMGVYLFKRLSFENRRKFAKSKKNKINYKELGGLAWPRTPTERLLSEMFDCGSGQFMAVEEALSDSNRRCVVTMLASGETEKEELENQDTLLELLYAAEYIVSGGSKSHKDFKAIKGLSSSQLSMAVRGDNGVQIRNFIRVVKFAFNYEAWELFRRWSVKIMKIIENNSDISTHLQEEVQVLNLLTSIDKYILFSSKRTQKSDAVKAANTNNQKLGQIKNNANIKTKQQVSKTVAINEKENLTDFTAESQETESTKEEDLLTNVAFRLQIIMNATIDKTTSDLDLIIDTILLLWRKCKTAFEKYQTGSEENFRWVLKLDNKWLYILNIVHEAMCFFGFTTIDLQLFMNCSVRLSSTYESLAIAWSKKKTVSPEKKTTNSSEQAKSDAYDCIEARLEKFNPPTSARENYMKAKEILKKSIHLVSVARAQFSKLDKKTLCDIDYDELDANHEAQTFDKLDIFSHHNDQLFEYKPNYNHISQTEIDLHTELLYAFQRMSLKLAVTPSDDLKTVDFEKEFNSVFKECRKNKVSQTLLLLCKASHLNQIPNTDKAEIKRTVKKALEKIYEAQEEDKLVCEKNIRLTDEETVIKCRLPPAPIVYAKTHSSVTVRPRRFETLNGVKPCWYRVFASKMSNINSKTRITDYDFPGTGTQIPADSCEFVKVDGLTRDEKYIFAVAAYSQDGELISNSIGDSTQPILVSDTYSILMCWSLLCQTCYQIGEYNLAVTAYENLSKYYMIDFIEPQPETVILKNQSDFKIKFYQLNYNFILKSSNLLLRKFIDCFFIATQIKTKEENLYCDNLYEFTCHYENQQKRLRECERQLVAIELGAWLNDYNVILQSIVTCYGLLTPLIYHGIAFEPITKILTHCMLVFEEIPASFLSRKPKTTQDSLHHMLACITFFVTDTLKRLEKNTLAHIFNLIGRKLMGEESPPLEMASIEATASNSTVNSGPEKDRSDSNSETTKKKADKQSKLVRSLEFRAYDNWLIREMCKKKKPSIEQISKPSLQHFTGNEEPHQVYTHIYHANTKLAYQDVLLFRKKLNFFEYFVLLLQKALEEELVRDINEWCFETFEWLQTRNATVLGPRQVMVKTKKTDFGLKALFEMEHEEAALNNEGVSNDKNTTNNNINNQVGVVEKAKPTYVCKTRPRPRIKKYRFIVSPDVDPILRAEIETKQKAAIDSIYYLFPIKHDNWKRRIRLRKLFQEEASLKSEYFNIWALSNFSILMNRIFQSSSQSRMNFLNRLGNPSYLDPQRFLFDKSGAILLNKDQLSESNTQDFSNKKSMANCASMIINFKRLTDECQPAIKKNNKKRDRSKDQEDKLYELRDTADLIEETLTKIIEPIVADPLQNTNDNINNNIAIKKPSNINPISTTEFTEIATRTFQLFRNSIVFAHRYKKWTDLQNSCKHMLNCINSLMVVLPAISHNNTKVFSVNELWNVLAPIVYIASESLIDMLFFNGPVDKQADVNSPVGASNKWFTDTFVTRAECSLKHVTAVDDCSIIDKRLVKDIVFRSLQCLAACEKSEKLLSIAIKFNILTGNKYANHLSPLIINAQHQVLKRMPRFDDSNIFLKKLKSQFDKNKTAADLLAISFKLNRPVSELKSDKTLAGYDLIKAPLDTSLSQYNLNIAINSMEYIDLLVFHSRRLLSIYLFSQSSHHEFFGINVISNSITTENTNRLDFDQRSIYKLDSYGNEIFFGVQPVDLKSKTFESDDEVFINDVQVHLETVVESYEKSIKLLLGYKMNDLAAQLMHELGNIYYSTKDVSSAYRHWNEALDTLIGFKNSLIQWRKEFLVKDSKQISTKRIMAKCGIWGCLLGGVLTSKMAQYYLANDLELQTECCLLSVTMFKSALSGSLNYSEFDLEYALEEADYLYPDLIPGIMFNSDTYRFDIRYVIAALNFTCLEMVNSGHWLNVLPAVSIYEYFARTISRDLIHTLFARIIKCEVLVKLNMFKEAIILLNKIFRGERLPHNINSGFKRFAEDKPRFTEFVWDASKPVYDLINLRCLETALCLRLPKHLIKLYPAQLTCRLYVLQCKLFVQVGSCLPCLPDFESFYSNKLYQFHYNNTSVSTTTEQLSNTNNPPVFSNNFKQPVYLDDNPDTIKPFTKLSQPLTLEFIKGCLLGTAKTLLLKCLTQFSDDFPGIDRYCVSTNWQREFKFECNLLLATVADQSQLGYLALQTLIDGLKELSDTQTQTPYSLNANKKIAEPKKSKLTKKGIYQMFDMTSKVHLNARRWLKTRIIFIQFMFNQLDDVKKFKGSHYLGDEARIVSNFGEIKYYCDKCIEESEKFFDHEAKAVVIYVLASLELIRGNITLLECQKQLQLALINFMACRQLSQEGQLNYLKTRILMNDVTYALNLLNLKEQNRREFGLEMILGKCIEEILSIENVILEDLRVGGGESVECFLDSRKAYFNTIYEEIKNLYNPLFLYLCHTKLRLGSCLILRASLEENEPIKKVFAASTCTDALNVLCIGIELNKVISERSINLEIELYYKQAYCLKELFTKHKLCSLLDVVEGYNRTINLAYNSSHDLAIIKNSYLELAVVFISVYEPTIGYVNAPKEFKVFQTSFNWMQLSSTASKKKNPEYMISNEAALTAFNYLMKCFQAIKARTLLPGHQSIKDIAQMRVEDIPLFVANDLLGNYVLAERGRVYRDEIEREVLELMPELEAKAPCLNYEQKLAKLRDESANSITWIDLLNYQTKMQHMNSMKNLNMLRLGRNRFKFADLYTIGSTPVIKNVHFISARLHELNKKLILNLEPYRSDCLAPILNLTYFKGAAVELSSHKELNLKVESLKSYVKYYNRNLAIDLNNRKAYSDSLKVEEFEWTYLQEYPANYNFLNENNIGNQGLVEDDSIPTNNLLNFIWYKSLVVCESDLVKNTVTITGIITYKDFSSNENCLRFKILSAELVEEIHEKLAPMSAIADTMLNKTYTNNKLDATFEESTIHILRLISKLFGKVYESKKGDWPFELISSNFVDLENMFNTKYGGHTNNHSLSTYISNLFL